MLRRKRTTTYRRGAASVELGLCLPIIVVFCLGSIEACTMIYLKQSLTIAAYEGARLANAEGTTSTQVEARCNSILADRRVSGASVNITPTEVLTVNQGDYFSVECTAPCASNAIVTPIFFAAKTLSGRAEFMKKYNGS